MIPSLYAVTPDTVCLMHARARSSVFWELDPGTAAEVTATDSASLEKEAWIHRVLAEQGGCGYSIGSVEESEAIASVLFCSPEDASGVVQLPTGPVSPDAMLLSSLFIDDRFGEIGLESVLVNAVILELTRRGVRAVEAFALRDPAPGVHTDEVEPGTGEDSARGLVVRARDVGLLRYGILEEAGFDVIADHELLPRMRLSLPCEDHLRMEGFESLPLAATPR
ncbi:hypothetical protein JIM95_004430 [Corynebacterium sp. CCM 8835]|uniref:N-acetyltransferase domain-containing protein n=1 Tax=Corynebacterium antarcticum TaxID=2800405 RepID=A0A9Q4GMI2_9CORY|nr:hypothetical protein [Corynebacterium antarcticum]MCK7642665.1 hypothetical protein [Corynebacterium antarcticum]MCK7660647.1 hypothetical protein [Corynebacterium antarcticum]MCL0245393.1 hypothetical protein [Corynebacterium antarcticum]MCX7492152.1 hypothetical protein [Corynebacterium antarcticum]MCX7537791.1 hypothetical protein [Corynebacterium antarcticum]